MQACLGLDASRPFTLHSLFQAGLVGPEALHPSFTLVLLMIKLM